jgi:ATP/maltotriose-dependent transcriptional regulator MalT/DNA-binding XRE family transcriptional regulator
VEPEISPAAGETIGERLKRLRLEKGLSQRELAAPGVSYAYISRIEAGTRQPSVKALRRLASKLGVSADYLETGSDLDPAAARELRLMDLELAVRLGEHEGVEGQIEVALGESLAAGDNPAALRARVALAQLALERGEYERAATLLESALADEIFAPVERFDIYANLGRAYASSGRPDRAAELFQSCIDGVTEAGGDASLEARYATLLSYALTDMGDIARAEEVVREALARTSDSTDPYMRVRLYWSIARLAHSEGRETVALENVRKAIALLQATDDTFHLARAHILAAQITLGRGSAEESEEHLDHAEQLLGTSATQQDRLYIAQHRARIALHRGDPGTAAELARTAIDLSRSAAPSEEGIALHVLADASAMSGDADGALAAYERAVELLEGGGRWRDASVACRAWGRLLREQNRETEAMDVLDRAAELGMRVIPDGARAER